MPLMLIFLHSYGVGRTGVYCLLHTMFHQIKREESVSIYQIARLYNHQRPHCILTKVGKANLLAVKQADWCLIFSLYSGIGI